MKSNQMRSGRKWNQIKIKSDQDRIEIKSDQDRIEIKSDQDRIEIKSDEMNSDHIEIRSRSDQDQLKIEAWSKSDEIRSNEMKSGQTNWNKVKRNEIRSNELKSDQVKIESNRDQIISVGDRIAVEPRSNQIRSRSNRVRSNRDQIRSRLVEDRTIEVDLGLEFRTVCGNFSPKTRYIGTRMLRLFKSVLFFVVHGLWRELCCVKVDLFGMVVEPALQFPESRCP
jgi:hypothetical protein